MRRASGSSNGVASQGLTAFDRRTGEGLLRNLVVRESRRGGELQVRLVTSPGRIDREGLARAVEPLGGLLWTQLDSVAETTQGGATELIAGGDRLEEEIGGMRMRISSARVLPDQHRDGRAALPAGDRVRRAGRPPIVCMTCTAGSAQSGC